MRRFERALTIATVAGALAACRATTRQTPSAQPAAELARPAQDSPVAHTGWHEKHKGGADLSTGIYNREDDDLVIDTPMPLVLRRTYNSGDGFVRQFGKDTTHPGELWLYGDGNPRVPWAELILAPGGRIRFTRISPGNTLQDAVLRHQGTPTEFDGAILSWSVSLWEIRLRDGSVALFSSCATPRSHCSILERRDADGHKITYVRDASGVLQRMDSEDQSIAFQYDDQQRIVRARDTLRREVSYTYDDRGRLVRAAGPNGIVRRYEYDDQDKLIAVREPGRIVQNWFDGEGRWVRQVVKDSENDPDPYVATVKYVVQNGEVVETTFDEGDGPRVDRYNAQHYIVSETVDADTATPIVFTLARDPVTNALNGVTMSCQGPSGPVTRSLPVPPNNEHVAKEEPIRESCLPRRSAR